MRKVIFLLLCFGVVAILSTPAMAIVYHWDDITTNWPDNTAFHTSDEIGTPMISGMDVTVDDSSGFLEEIEIFMTGRRVWDSLFINTSRTDGINGFDYYIYDGTLAAGGHTMYELNPGYTFSYVTPALGGRIGHQNGIATGLGATSNLIASVDWNGSSLSYIFNPGLVVGSEFLIGYTPWCANDVILTPEPSVALFLGIMLIGAGAFGRRRLIKR